jgi:predicted metal-dependent hydrolase
MSRTSKAFADGDRMTVAGATVTLRVHRRARRVSLRLDRTGREIVATAPSPRRLAEAAAFARERAGWIAQQMAELPTAVAARPGLVLQVFGERVKLETGEGRAKWIPATLTRSARITAMGEGEGFARAVILVIRARALAVLTERTAHHCARLGVVMPKVTIMDAKARWGSCRPGPRRMPGSIRYSWRLALAPYEVADYVVAHEVAHLLELNHGPEFWAHVKTLVGDADCFREWLRSEGARLHAFGY